MARSVLIIEDDDRIRRGRRGDRRRAGVRRGAEPAAVRLPDDDPDQDPTEDGTSTSSPTT
jgi:hypothetical protein